MINLIKQIDHKIEEYTESIIADTVKLININSEESEPIPGAPFGKGPRQVLDTVLEMGKNEGFFTMDYGVGVISVAMKDTQPDLGIWAHGDVVPAGNGWIYPPFDATLYKNCIIGRGATDNKGQLSAIFNLLKIFKEMGIQLKYNPALYVGSNEESGMKEMVGIEGNPDARGFVNVCTPPKMSLVPDSGFPIGYGARGLTAFRIKSKTPLHGFSFIAGQNDEPGLAMAVLDTVDFPDKFADSVVKKEDGKTIVTTFSYPKHTSNPDPDGNMITKLASVLLDSGVVNEEDRYILEFLKSVSLDISGKWLGIYTESKLMKPTTVYAQSVDYYDGYCELRIRVRYPIEITYDELKQKLVEFCESKGFELKGERGHMPYVNDGNTEMINTLARIANSVTGSDAKPYITGSTYAHYLPNAYVYGMDGCMVPDGFPEGHGDAHGVDECVSVDRLKRAMRIYARTLLELNNMEW